MDRETDRTGHVVVGEAGDAIAGVRAADRFRGLQTAAVLGIEVPVASTARSRLMGLVWLDRSSAGSGLLLPGCRSVHTFGMRFSLDLVFLDSSGRPLKVRCGVGPGRVLWQPGAWAVLEVPSGGSGGEPGGSGP